MSQVTLQELQKTSVFREAEREAEANRYVAQQAYLAAATETARMRAEAGKLATLEVTNAIARYEVLRAELHEQLRAIWAAGQEYSRLTGVLPPQLPLTTYNSINLPSLVKDEWSSGFSTTRAAVMSYMNTNGKGGEYEHSCNGTDWRFHPHWAFGLG